MAPFTRKLQQIFSIKWLLITRITILICFLSILLPLCSCQIKGKEPGTEPALIIGSSTTGTDHMGGNFVLYARYIATSSGHVNQIRVYSMVNGNAKVAIYSDNGGEPGTMLAANNTSQAVSASQWNSLSISSTHLTHSTAYWLGICIDNDGAASCSDQTNGSARYKPATYSSFTFPSTAGTGFTSTKANMSLAGWGIVGSTPQTTNEKGTETGSPPGLPKIRANTQVVIIALAVLALLLIFLFMRPKKRKDILKTILLLVVVVTLLLVVISYISQWILINVIQPIIEWLHRNVVAIVLTLIAVIVLLILLRKRTQDNGPPQPPTGKEGYIYIARCPSHEADLYKIGRTKNHPVSRVGDLGKSTSAPEGFILYEYWKVTDSALAESLVFKALEKYRPNPKKEFFKARLATIIPIVQETIKDLIIEKDN